MNRKLLSQNRQIYFHANVNFIVFGYYMYLLFEFLLQIFEKVYFTFMQNLSYNRMDKILQMSNFVRFKTWVEKRNFIVQIRNIL